MWGGWDKRLNLRGMKGNKNMGKYNGSPGFAGALSLGGGTRKDEAGQEFRAKKQS